MIGEWFRRLWYLLNRSRFEEALRRDMEAHRSMMDRPAGFGNTLRIREEARDVWGWAWLDDIVRELQIAFRSLCRTPGFSLAAILSLALGLALTASTTAVVNAYLLRSMPYPAADRLFHVIYAPQGQPEPGGMARLDWKGLSDVVELVDNSAFTRLFIADGAYKQDWMGLSVAAGTLDLLGIHPALGRSLRAEDFRHGSESAVLISQSLWRNRFGSDPNILGRSFLANRSNLAEPEEAFRVVGVLAPEFRYARAYARGPMQFVAPIRAPMQSYMIRLREGVPLAFAERRLTEMAKSIAQSIPPGWAGIKLESVHQRYVAELRPVLLAITASAAIVLLIVCVNIAVLTLLRAIRRQQEVAVRVALGAGRRHIVRMLVAESVLLCGAALALGMTLTANTLDLLAPVIEERLGRSAPGGTAAIALDSTVLAVGGGAGLLVALVLSWVPLMAPWQLRLADALRRGGRGGTDVKSVHWFRSPMIALEVGASLALLVGCALMIRSVVNLVRTDLGIQTTQIVRARVALPPRTYRESATFLRFFKPLAQQLSESTEPFAFSNFIPFYQTPTQRVEVDAGAGEPRQTGVLAISEGYLAMLGVSVIQGRAFSAADGEGAEPVALVSDTLARRLWPQGGALGRRIRTADEPVPGSPLTVWRNVVGVTADVRQTYTDQELNDVYIPFYQAPSRYAQVFLKTGRSQPLWVKSLLTAGAAIDPQVQISTEMTGAASLEVEADRQLAGPRFLTSVLTGFAAFAALLAILGIYGVTAYSVQQREREVAIRIALGASTGDVVRMFLINSGRVLAVGIALGLFAAGALAKMLEHQLFGVTPFDIPTLVASSALMAAVGLLATWWPARRTAIQRPAGSLNEI